VVQQLAETPAALGGPAALPVLSGETFEGVIADADPFAGAIAGLSLLNPGAAAQTRLRVKGLESEIADALENARLDARLDLADYLQRQATFCRRRAILEHRLALLDPGGSLPARPSIEAQVYGLTVAVQRWRSGVELRACRALIMRSVTASLAEAQSQVRSLVDAYPSGGEFVIGVEQRKAGLHARDDEWLRRMMEALATRRRRAARVAHLDAQGDVGRAVKVAQAIDQAGGVDTLASLLAPAMSAPSAAAHRAAHAEATKIEESIRSVDPETRRASELKERLAHLLTRKDALASAIAREQTAAATLLIERAQGGPLEGIADLESAVALFNPSVAASLAQIRGNEAELIAVVANLISLERPKPPTETQ